MDWIELGYLGLFLASFLAATVIPFSSEAVLSGMILGGFDPMNCLLIASTGNTLGGMSSYGLGWIGDWHRLHKWIGVDQSKVEHWKGQIDKFGYFLALFCWTPFVGDVIAVALGVFRTHPLVVTVLMFVGKATRYAVLIWVFKAFTA